MARVRIGNTFIGSPVERIEDLRFLRGRGEYVDDLVRADLLHAAIVRSPVAHGRLRGIDARAALAIAGVHGVVTAGRHRHADPDHSATRRASRCRGSLISISR